MDNFLALLITVGTWKNKCSAFFAYFYDQDVISAYNTDLVTKASVLLARHWDTKTLDIPRDMEAPYMRMVRLPDMKQFSVPKETGGDPKVCHE